MTGRALGLAVLLALGGCGGAGSSGGTTASDAPITFDDEAQANRAPAASEEVERGEGLLATGDAAGAEAAFRAAIEADANDVRAHLDLGLALEMQDRIDEAEQAYRAAVAIDETFAEALNNLGVLLRDTDRAEEAAQVLGEAVRVRPGFASAQLNYGLALEELGRAEEAMAAYRRVMELAPREPTSRIQRGPLQLAAGDREQALLTLRRAAPLARGSRANLSALGNGLRRAGDAEMSVRVLREAIDADEEPAPPPVVAELALAQFAAGHREDAEATLTALLREHDDYADGHYLLANMLAARRAFGDAARHYQRYLRLEPRGPLAQEAQGRLDYVRRQ